ncbi:MAG: hypothetical protein M1834_001069 [Cirrosporium novae-zelandiae]|nr:MAG: hypothetical protein M1834_001069 [Cirrosporium novae-zelandiae]
MDAKPQRPTRNFRVRADENVPPAVVGSKSLHQRHKSTPSLSTMLGGGGLKAAAKRAAFGDVSNTNAQIRSTKDDSIAAAKASIEVHEKAIHTQEDKKAGALQRPAQRPISVSNLRGLLNNVNPLHKQPLVEKPYPASTANTRKTLSKHRTAVFKDPVPSNEEPHIKIERQSSTNASVAPIHRNRDSKSKPTNIQRTSSIAAQRAVAESYVKPSNAVLALQHGKPAAVPDSSKSVDAVARNADGISLKKAGTIRVHKNSSHNVEIKQDISNSDHESVKENEKASSDVNIAPAVSKVEVIRTDPQAPHSAPIPVESEIEEYWDDEEDDEGYEETGYVTAQSFRSRTDNTTGGATTVVVPAVNQKIEKELALAKQLIEATKTPEEIEDESWDTSMVAEYGDEIFDYMRTLEKKMLPNAHYMDNQAEITWSMRSVLMDWLVQVHHRFNLLPETLFLCVNYIDRFLSCKIVSLGKLQLVGATAIFIAAKYEEINCPSVQEIVYMVDGSYAVDELLKAERFMLSMLQFELGWPGPMSFLRRISKADDYDLETRTLAKYFLEITIMDERFVGSPPSFTSAGAHCLARLMLRKGCWSAAHVYYSGYTYSQLYKLVSLMLECCENPQKHHSAVYEKFMDKRYKCAARFVESELKKGFNLPPASTTSLPLTMNISKVISPW